MFQLEAFNASTDSFDGIGEWSANSSASGFTLRLHACADSRAPGGLPRTLPPVCPAAEGAWPRPCTPHSGHARLTRALARTGQEAMTGPSLGGRPEPVLAGSGVVAMGAGRFPSSS